MLKGYFKYLRNFQLRLSEVFNSCMREILINFKRFITKIKGKSGKETLYIDKISAFSLLMNRPYREIQCNT